MKVIGVTGGVGAGKSEVLKIMAREFGAHIIMADEVGHRLMEPGGATYERILEVFGRDLAGSDGRIDKEKLGRQVFANEERLRILNGIVHPLVRQAIEEEIDELQDAERMAAEVAQQKEKEDGLPSCIKKEDMLPSCIETEDGLPSCIVVESAILEEGGLVPLCDVVWYIAAEEQIRVHRIMETRGYPAEKAEAILSSQKSDAAYRDISDVVIDNSGSLEATKEQIDRELCRIL